MNQKNWREPEHYAYTSTLNAGQWAWEFLRRNPDYQRDWQWFQQRWQALESRYGKPPERDFQRWQHDPDAWVQVDDDTGECRVDEDKVLIECWMGGKWGFYKFPLDPAIEQPRMGEQLSWRETEQPVQCVQDGDDVYLGEDAARVALGFDLDLPLRQQLEAARRFLQIRQAGLRRSGEVVMRTVGSLASHWCCLLRMLDGVNSGESAVAVHALLASACAGEQAESTATSLLAEAQQLVAGGYRELLRLPG